MKNLYLIIIPIIFIAGCKKEFLDSKPSTTILQPVTLDNFTNLLDANILTNTSSALPVLSSDEFVYKDYASWQSTRTATERNAYVWATNLYGGETKLTSWSKPYTAIFYSNVVLNGLEQLERTSENQTRWDYIKGWALFIRAYYLFDLVKNFSKSYDASSANTDLGIPLKLSANIDEIVQRSTVQQTYDQILKDLSAARILLGTSGIPTAKKNRPSTVAAYALQARIYLSMRNYAKAELSADSCLNLYSKLIDYRQVSTTGNYPFTTTNDEALFTTTIVQTYAASTLSSNNYIIMSNSLINLYAAGDLRSQVFFKPVTGGYLIKGGYFGPGLYAFTGLATDEIILIKAECSARKGNTTESINQLNKLLINRFTTASFKPLQATSATDALNLTLLERRKELVWRGLRWDDLKRLNMENSDITLTRSLNGVIYTLLPNDPKYVFPIPDDEIALSHITQNQR